VVGAVTTPGGRDRVALRPPSTALADFPAKQVEAGRRWWREHGTAGPWYFAAGTAGRFNLAPPHGTLYLASRPESAARERIGLAQARTGWVPASLVAGRFVSELELPVDVRAAHITHPDAPRRGVVSSELGTVADYGLTRAWAQAFFDAGLTGLWFLLRFSGHHGRGLAVFGDEGSRPWAAPATPMPVRELLEDHMHVQVVDPPPASSLTVVP
jgi:hypothetical protein